MSLKSLVKGSVLMPEDNDSPFLLHPHRRGLQNLDRMARYGDRAIRLQADTFERLVLGQMHETVGPQDGEDPVQFYLQVLSDKTGSLIAAAAQSGIIFSNGPEELEEPMFEFGEKAGVAFQLLDDVIDLSADAGETGKVPGTDLRAGVPTMPYLLLGTREDEASVALRERIDDGVARIADGADPAWVASIAMRQRSEGTSAASGTRSTSSASKTIARAPHCASM
jgi:heptaprenyl diphosphate synthase